MALRRGAAAPGDDVLACLIGGAVGDALGAEVEFMALSEIRAAHPGGVPMPDPAAITDDTQMTLFTAEGLVEAAARGTDPVATVHAALLRWLRTQGTGGPSGAEGLLGDARLHASRAPGMTCLAALEEATELGTPARNESKGCGTIMRVAPCAFAPAPGPLARETSRLTHGHPTGAEAAAFWAELLKAVRHGAALGDAVRALRPDHGGEVGAAVDAAMAAGPDGRPETVEALGGGWVAEEALSIALYAARAADGFEAGLRIAVTHSGDSDSTGAVAGNLLGLLHTEEALSHPWRAALVEGAVVERIAADLARAFAA